MGFGDAVTSAVTGRNPPEFPETLEPPAAAYATPTTAPSPTVLATAIVAHRRA
jgi:hypothetical protein